MKSQRNIFNRWEKKTNLNFNIKIKMDRLCLLITQLPGITLTISITYCKVYFSPLSASVISMFKKDELGSVRLNKAVMKPRCQETWPQTSPTVGYFPPGAEVETLDRQSFHLGACIFATVGFLGRRGICINVFVIFTTPTFHNLPATPRQLTINTKNKSNPPPPTEPPRAIFRV